MRRTYYTKHAFIFFGVSRRFQGFGLWLDCNGPEIKPVLFALHLDLFFIRFYMIRYKA